MLVILGLVCLLLSTSIDMSGVLGFFGQFGVLCADVVVPAGFLSSAMGHDRQSPSRWVYLLYTGAALLAVSLVILGIALIAN